MSAWLNLISRIRRPCDVLIVEHEALNAQALAALVHEAGGTVVGIAEDTVDALLLAAEHVPNIVIVDIDLPTDADAVRVAREIRDMTDASIIFCGHDDLATQARLLAFGRAQLLPKPVDFESLSCAMLRVCR